MADTPDRATRPDLDGLVAIVTGAGQGLGRAEAMELAAAGTRVVVNDVGSGLRGGSVENRADEVVEDIRAAGGTAIADGGDVADFDDARSMVQLAVDTFGRFDILVNNAGILRERMLFNMKEDEWDDVLRVHLKGHFCMSRWAAEYWRDASKASGGPVYGRIVNTSSEAFLNGSVGQPNYAAAKAGIVQLTVNAAQALGRFGVTANAICPRARTRMTEHRDYFHLVAADVDVFAPENVTPLVNWLAAPASAAVTGQVFVVYGTTIMLLAPPSVEHRFDNAVAWNAADVHDQLGPFFANRDITDNFGVSFDVVLPSGVGGVAPA